MRPRDFVLLSKYNHLIANLLVFHNCKTMTEALKELQDEGMPLTPDILRALSPYRQHASRFGTYNLRDREASAVDYDVRLDLSRCAVAAL